jgi:hypothetical protein
MEENKHINSALNELSPLLEGISKTMPQTVPLGYFDSFADKMLILAKNSSISVEAELDSIAPLLNTIAKRPVQSLPEGYFKDFQIAQKQETAIVRMPRLRKWMSYAAAAMIAGILITAGFIFNNNNSKSFDYAYYSKIDVPAALNQVTDDELQNYLNTTALLSGTEQLTIPEEVENIDQGNFQQISDDELNEYLKEIGDSKINQKGS